MNTARRRAQEAAGRHVPAERRVPIAVSDWLYARIQAASGGSSVATRLVFERALERAMRAELDGMDSRQRAEVSRQRRRFGWRW